jgi:YVTN family beta-propeller protein
VTGVAGGPATITATAVPAVATAAVTVLGHPVGIPVTGTPLGDRPYGVAVSPAGVVYVTRLDAAALSRADLPDSTFPTAVAVGSVPTDVAFDPTGTRAYVTNQASRNVGIVDVATNTQIDVIPVNGDPFRVLVSPSGTRLYVTTNADNLLVIDLPAKTVHAEYLLGSASSGITFHPNGVLLYGTTIGGVVYEINTVTDSARGLLTTGYLQDIAVSRDGAELYVAKEDGPMEIRNAATGVLITTLPAATGVFGLRVTPDGRHLYAGILFGGEVRVFDRASRALLRTIPVANDPRRLAFDRYGRTAVITDQLGAVYFVR